MWRLRGMRDGAGDAGRGGSGSAAGGDGKRRQQEAGAKRSPAGGARGLTGKRVKRGERFTATL